MAVEVQDVLQAMGPFVSGYARILVTHKDQPGELHAITGALLEVNIHKSVTLPQSDGTAHTLMDLDPSTFTSNETDIVHALSATSGVVRVLVLFRG
jgi:hypothetical protein